MFEDYFSLLGLPLQFDVDNAQLEQAYFAAQRTWHPDRFAGRGAEEKARAMMQATRINDAYHLLKSPLKRARYMLQLRGVEQGAAEPEILMEAMEQRERFEQAKTLQDIVKIEKEISDSIILCISMLNELFNAKDIIGAGQVALRFQYLEKLAEEIRIKKLKGSVT